MAFEQTPPATKLILATAVGSSALLLGLIPFFHGYFNQMVAEQYQVKVVDVPNTTRDEVNAREQQNLRGAPLTIDAAMQQLGRQGRLASPVIAPQASSSVDAVEGWNKLPNIEARAAAEAAQGQAALPAEAVSADAGAPSPEEEARAAAAAEAATAADAPAAAFVPHAAEAPTE